jgi:geranylgeranyl diphosphate synthase type II
VNFASYVEQRTRAINAALERYFPADKHQPHALYRAIRYSLLDGGKRIRPLLAIAAAEAAGGRLAAVLPFACAIEMVHTYSLIHDDLPAMDDDRLRRGKPTSHIVFGEGMAILAGDALLTEAFRVMTDAAVTREIGPKRAVQVAHGVAEAAGALGMVAGQAADLEAEGSTPDLAAVEFIHVRKTGALILAAVRTGALVAAARPSTLRCLTRYGEYLGLAFQVVDDVLGAAGHADETGKEAGGDERHRKATYAAVLGVVRARERAVELGDEALKQIDGFGKRAEPLREIARSVVARAMPAT